MIVLILGIALWWGAHLFKRAAPAQRAALAESMGEGAKAIPAVVILAGVVLMVIGYRGAPYVGLWTPPVWTVHLNNLLMLGAVILFGMGSSKGRMRAWLRHPMLTGTAVWAVAHLAVNGDLASVVLFGGLLAWALAEMAVINRAEPDWQRPEPGALPGDIRLVVIGVVLYAVIAAIHAWLGVWPFAG